MKQLKRVASATVIATLVMTGIVPALAADTQNGTKSTTYIEPTVEPALPEGTMSKEQAIAKVKTMFAKEIGHLQMIDASYDPQSSTGAPCWELSFGTNDKGAGQQDGKLLEQIHIGINAKTGVLVHFNHVNPAWQGDHYPYEDVAEAAADRFLDLYAPAYHQDFKSEGVKGSGHSYSGNVIKGNYQEWSTSTLMYEEIVNGIPFRKNGLQFDVDQFGNVTGFYASVSCDVSTLPTPERALSLTSAQTLYAQHFPLMKVYHSPWVSVETDVPDGDLQLMYTPSGNNQMIDAFTGQPVVMSNLMQTPMLHENVTLTSNGEWVPNKKEEITHLMEQITGKNLSDFTVKEMNQPDAAIWEFVWEKQLESQNKSINVRARFDAKTGQLLSYSQNGGLTARDATYDAKLTIVEGQQKAQELLQKILPKGQQELILMRKTDTTLNQQPAWLKPENRPKVDHMGQNVYVYDYCFAHQGVPIIDKQISVLIDRATGAFVDFYVQPAANEKLADNSGTITPSDAEVLFFKEHPLHLEYVWDQVFDQFAPHGELVYVPEDISSERGTYIDAFTGKTVAIHAR